MPEPPSPPARPVPAATLDGSGERLGFALRLAVICGTAIGAVGLVDHLSRWPLLTSALGPTAYLLVAHPRSVSARLRNAMVGHSVGVGAGLAALCVFGLFDAPSVGVVGHAGLRQAGSAALAVGITLFLLHSLRAHHAPAAATALLVATDQAKVGPPLYGLLIGLAAILLCAYLLEVLPFLRWGGQRFDES